MPTRLWGDVQRARYGRFPDSIGEDDNAAPEGAIGLNLTARF